MPSVAEGYHIGPGKSTTLPSWQKAPLSSTELEQGSVISDVSEQVCACLLSCFSRVQICDPMDCSRPGSSVHGILHARILERVAMPSSRGSSQPRDWTQKLQVDSLPTEPPGKPFLIIKLRNFNRYKGREPGRKSFLPESEIGLKGPLTSASESPQFHTFCPLLARP